MKTKEVSTIQLLKILRRYAAKHAVSFNDVESNAIIEAMYDYATLKEITDEEIEIYARRNSLTKATEDGIIKGAKDFRDNKIKHIE